MKKFPFKAFVINSASKYFLHTVNVYSESKDGNSYNIKIPKGTLDSKDFMYSTISKKYVTSNYQNEFDTRHDKYLFIISGYNDHTKTLPVYYRSGYSAYIVDLSTNKIIKTFNNFSISVSSINNILHENDFFTPISKCYGGGPYLNSGVIKDKRCIIPIIKRNEVVNIQTLASEPKVQQTLNINIPKNDQESKKDEDQKDTSISTKKLIELMLGKELPKQQDNFFTKLFNEIQSTKDNKVLTDINDLLNTYSIFKDVKVKSVSMDELSNLLKDGTESLKKFFETDAKAANDDNLDVLKGYPYFIKDPKINKVGVTQDKDGNIILPAVYVNGINFSSKMTKPVLDVICQLIKKDLSN